jgi:small subunit ribosomal protein S11
MAEEKPQETKEQAAPAAAPAEGAAPGAEGAAEAKPARRAKTKGSKNVPVGLVHITATFNNTIVSITDMKGAVIAWSSAGRSGFKGSRKSTAFAATVAAQDAARQAAGHGLQEVEVRVQGPGAGRESAIRAIQSAGINVTAIRDVTPMPHNGCRAPKRRRV